jgi:uncharacterized protein (DUF849 family)
MPKKVIITCAVTGASFTPSMSPYLPITPDQIVQESLAAHEAGAAIIHLHARDPKDGRPTSDPKVWSQFVPRIRQACPAIINMSSAGKTLEDRMGAVLELKPEVATVIVGSMNYGLFAKAGGQAEFKYEWEKEYFGPKSYDIITSNSFKTIGMMVDAYIENNIMMEFECYDVGHLYIVKHHIEKKKMRHPLIVQFLTGILGGIMSDPPHLQHMKDTALNLFGSDMELFTHGTLENNMRAAVYGAMVGTNVRVGIEDNLFAKPGVPYKSNVEQVQKIKRILDDLNIDVATVKEARERLNLN